MSTEEMFLPPCARSVLPIGIEMWPLSKEDLHHLVRSEHDVVRSINDVKLSQRHPTDDLMQKLRIQHIEEMIS